MSEQFITIQFITLSIFSNGTIMTGKNVNITSKMQTWSYFKHEAPKGNKNYLTGGISVSELYDSNTRNT